MGESNSLLMPEPVRVAHMGTGHTGTEALSGIIADPALELVGWYVSTPTKVGTDAGTYCGGAAIGIQASNVLASLIDLQPDCVFYASSIIGRESDAIAEVVQFLEAGIDVVSFAFLQMVYPPAAPTDMREAISAACHKGNSTFFASGSEPGVFTTTLPATLLSAAGRVSRYRELQVIPDIIAAYPVASVIRESMGFGQPMGTLPGRFSDGTISTWWEPNLHMVANKLGLEIEDVRFDIEFHPLAQEIDTELGVFAAGSIGAYWWKLTGIVNGRPFLSVEYVCQLTREVEVPDDWPRGAPDTGECAVVYSIEGDPALKVQVYMSNSAEGKNPSVSITAMHVVNAIPHVVAAPAGLCNALDLPHYTTRTVD